MGEWNCVFLDRARVLVFVVCFVTTRDLRVVFSPFSLPQRQVYFMATPPLTRFEKGSDARERGQRFQWTIGAIYSRDTFSYSLSCTLLLDTQRSCYRELDF